MGWIGRADEPLRRPRVSCLRAFRLQASRRRESRRPARFPALVPAPLLARCLRPAGSDGGRYALISFLPVSSAGPVPGSFSNFYRLCCSLPNDLLVGSFAIIIAYSSPHRQRGKKTAAAPWPGGRSGVKNVELRPTRTRWSAIEKEWLDSVRPLSLLIADRDAGRAARGERRFQAG